MVFLTGLALGNLVYAQDPSQTQPQQKQDDARAQKVSVIGCLAKGNASGEYTITEPKTGEKVPFSGPAALDKYVNQTVKLTGTVTGKVFQPESIDQVSATCEPAK